MTDTTIWVIQLFVALVSAIFVCQYIAFKIEHKNAVKEWQRKKDLEQINELLPNSAVPHHAIGYSFNEIMEKINEMFEQGFLVGLDTSLFSKYPQITELLNHKNILLTEEIANYIQRRNNVVYIQGCSSQLKITPMMVSFINKIGLDSDNISDRAIGSYFYAEKTNLINVKFVTLNQESFEKANLIGLRAILF